MLFRIVLCTFLVSGFAVAEPPADVDADAKVDPEKHAAEARRREIAQSAQAAVIGGDANVVALALHKDPIYKYHEVERGFHHAVTWMWTNGQGRPSVILNLSGSNALFYEFMSLTNERVKFDVGDASWMPKNGWNPKPIPTKSKPGRTRGLRLGQMRSIARTFSAYEVDYEKANKKHHLRLLPEPMYRYAKDSDESLDGAMFAFVRNGDLEIILTIEAAKNADGSSEWVFDCDRVAVYEQHVAFDKDEVWNCLRTNFGSTEDEYYVKIVDLTR